MTRPDAAGRAVARMLRWYPAAWRARYGDELVSRVKVVSSESGTALLHQIVRAGDNAELARLKTAWLEDSKSG